MQAAVSINDERNAMEDFEYTRRQWNRPMKVEFRLRYSLGWPLSCIILASVSLKKLASEDDNFSSCYKSVDPELLKNLVSDTRAATGWTLFFSLVVLLYQIFAVLQLFFYVKILYMKIQLGKFLWYLFPLIDIGANVIVIIGYLPSAIAMAVYSSKWAKPILNNDDVVFCILNYVLPFALTCLLAFGTAVHSTVMIFFIIFAKLKLKWPNYYVPEN